MEIKRSNRLETDRNYVTGSNGKRSSLSRKQGKKNVTAKTESTGCKLIKVVVEEKTYMLWEAVKVKVLMLKTGSREEWMLIEVMKAEENVNLNYSLVKQWN